jgi:DNA ligase-associated metallophosphoesterase
MNGPDPAHPFTLCGARLRALPSGALHWPEAGVLAVADLHLGKAERLARRGGALLPPYETEDTLARLEADIAAIAPTRVLCLGDSFDDDDAAGALSEAVLLRLARLMAGREWDWIAGNHDPAPLALAGSHRATVTLGPLTFRHIAEPAARGEVSGHYHPKARLALGGARVARPCFLIDAARVILPAYGTYTGGLSTGAEALAGLMGDGALAVLTGPRAQPLPMPRNRQG